MEWLIPILIVGAVGLVLLMFIVGIYNGLVKLRNRYENAYSQIDVQMKRRFDLIPNLVETAKGYLKHEQETLTKVIEARNQAIMAGKNAAAHPGDPSAMKQMASAESQLGGALSRLLMVAESYPEHVGHSRRIDFDREQNFVCPPRLQRCRD
jgi:LemA protein